MTMDKSMLCKIVPEHCDVVNLFFQRRVVGSNTNTVHTLLLFDVLFTENFIILQHKITSPRRMGCTQTDRQTDGHMLANVMMLLCQYTQLPDIFIFYLLSNFLRSDAEGSVVIIIPQLTNFVLDRFLFRTFKSGQSSGGNPRV